MKTTPQNLIEHYRNEGWWGDETLTDWLLAAVDARPDELALVDHDQRPVIAGGSVQRLSYVQMAEKVMMLCSQFYEAGIRMGDIVIVQLPNIAELPITYFALDRLGAIISPVPVQYGRFEINNAIAELSPAAYVTTYSFKKAPFVDEKLSLFKGVCPVLCFGESASPGIGHLDLHVENIGSECSEYVGSLVRSADDIVTICWTSGTTGQPKGVPRSHNHWRVSGFATIDTAGFSETDVLLNPFPLVNMAAIGGFLFPWIMCKSTLVLHHPFDLQGFLKQIENEKVSYTIAAPAVLNMLLNERGLLEAIDLSSLRAIGSGGAPLTDWMVRCFQEDYKIVVDNIFGSNEGLCLTSNGRDLPDAADRAQYFPRLGLEGKVWGNRVAAMTKTRLVDLETRKPVTEPGVRAELEISGPSVFDGYWQAEETNREVFSADGYFRTGDVFEIPIGEDKRTYYRFVGRSKDIIVRGGMKISPDEIDSVLAGHPMLAAAAVAGYDDPVMGDRIGVAVVPALNEAPKLEDITGYLKEQGLAIFKLPERLIVLDALPVNATGKVLRRELQNLFKKED